MSQGESLPNPEMQVVWWFRWWSGREWGLWGQEVAERGARTEVEACVCWE